MSFLSQWQKRNKKGGGPSGSSSPSPIVGQRLTKDGVYPVTSYDLPTTIKRSSNSLVERMHGSHRAIEAATPRQFINGIERTIIGGNSEQGLSFREQAMQNRGYLVVQDESDVYNPCDLIAIEAEVAFNVACMTSPEDKARREAELMFSFIQLETSDEQELIDQCLSQLDALDSFDNTDIDVVWQRRPHRGNIGLFNQSSVYYGDEQGVQYG